MRKPSWYIMAAGLFLAILISNVSGFINDGRKLDELRGSVLRLHILANSDSDRDQKLKLMVRDKLLESNFFSEADTLSEAEVVAAKNLRSIECTAEKVLREYGCRDKVTAELEDISFDERVYGKLTMPSGEYPALRIKIGKAQGHNWWCVMYPPLCIPAACEVETDKKTEQEYFDEEEREILEKPKKYKVRFAIWDKAKEIKKSVKSKIEK